MNETINLTVKSRIQETHDTVTLVFEETFDNLPYTSGQFLTVIVTLDNEIFKREYSFSSSPQVDKHVAITVKRVNRGKVSTFLTEDVSRGDKISTLPPAGKFVANLSLNQKRTVVLIGGGSGITPLFSMAKSILAIEQNSKVYLLYANRTENDIIFIDEWKKLRETYTGRFNNIDIISNPSSSWYGIKDRISKDNLNYYLEQLPVIFPKETEYYLCAPKGLMTEIEDGLRILNIPSAKIHRESFGSSATGEKSETTVNSDKIVKVKYRGDIHEIKVTAGKSILKSALEQNIRIPFSCERGNCTACLGTCVTGKVDMGNNDTLSANELAKGYVLTCISKPLTDDVYIEID